MKKIVCCPDCGAEIEMIVNMDISMIEDVKNELDDAIETITSEAKQFPDESWYIKLTEGQKELEEFIKTHKKDS